MLLLLISSVFILYTYLGYPLVLLLLGMVRGKFAAIPPVPDYPAVSLLIPAYNEEAVIVGKLENALGLDYPRNRLEIVVADDGSGDRTAELVRPYISRGVELAEYSQHRGKMSVINRTMDRLSGEIVVFTDASAIFRKDALRLLVSGFSRPSVGAVSGALILKEEEGTGGELPVDWYWRMEKFIRERESRCFSCVSATGAIYALRRALFEPLPDDTILDDLLIPLGAIRRGYRILFEGRALAYEEGYTNLKLEFRRKVRTLAGNYQAFSRAGWAIIPGKSGIAFYLISHKLCRLLAPFALLGLFISCLLGPIDLLPLLILQIIFYALAGYGLFASITGRSDRKIFSVPLTFCLLNTAALQAFFIYFLRKKQPVWK